jgi:hypothetical protein
MITPQRVARKSMKKLRGDLAQLFVNDEAVKIQVDSGIYLACCLNLLFSFANTNSKFFKPVI